MKKILLSLLAIELLIAPTVGLAAAAPPTDVLKVIDNIVKYAYGIFLTVAILCVIIAAYCFTTSAGDPQKVTRAKDFLLYTLIGVLVAVLSKGLVALIKKIAGVS